MFSEEEIWVDIINYENLYQISNFGRVMSYDKSYNMTNRFGFKFTMQRPKKYLSLLNKRYSRVALTKNGIVNHYSVHRLVSIAFINNPIPHINKVVNHKDGNKLNNHFGNLEWCTAIYNTQHAYKTGLIDKSKLGKHRKGESPANAKLVLDLRTGIYIIPLVGN